MKPRSSSGKPFWVSVLSGSTVAVILGFLLMFSGISFQMLIAAFLGGVVAGWLLQGSIKGGVTAGFAEAIVYEMTVTFVIFPFMVFLGLPLPGAGQVDIPTSPETIILLFVIATAMIGVSGALGGLAGTYFSERLKLEPAPPPIPTVQEAHYCSYCGKTLPYEAVYCPHCGRKIP